MADYSRFANLADASLRQTIHDFEDNPPEQFDRRYPENFVSQIGGSTIAIRRFFPIGHPFPLRDDRYNDGWYTVDYVKQHDANAWGLYDVIGNVWEWTADWHAADYYARSPVDDPQGPPSGGVRVRRGGSWHSWPLYSRVAFRNWNTPQTRYVLVGFRLVRETPGAADAR